MGVMRLGLVDVRIELPSEQVIELCTDMEFSGTETGSLNPEAWPRNMRRTGSNWIDHALMPAEDPALVERFFMEALDFRPAERAVTDPAHPELIGTWMYTRGMTIYFFDPSGNRNEVFADGYRTGPDFPTITWAETPPGQGHLLHHP